ncbi:MAG: hypothetical protein ACQERC_06465 [Bacteroidota bacterium]
MGDLVFDSIADHYVTQSDLMEGETENENESKKPPQNPTEEEEEHAPFKIPKLTSVDEEYLGTFKTLFFWYDLSPNIPTEPPEQAV